MHLEYAFDSFKQHTQETDSLATYQVKIGGQVSLNQATSTRLMLALFSQIDVETFGALLL